MHKVTAKQKFDVHFMMVQRLQTDHAHEPEPGNAQRSRWSSSSMSIRPAPYEPMACETTKGHANVTWVCEVMWVSCVAYTQSNGGHMISHTSIMFCASRLFPSRLQPGSMVPPYKLMPIWGCRRFWKIQDRINRQYLSGSSGCQVGVWKCSQG